MSESPAILTYEGEGVFRAPTRAASVHCDRQYVVGEVYRMACHEERSGISHRHFFACIREAWLSLDDKDALEFTSEERLRKRALIATGYYTERRVVASSAREARKFARFMMESADDGTVIATAGTVVIQRTARSQSLGVNGMRKAEFQKSKTDVLDWIAALIGTDTKTLEANAPSIAPDAPATRQREHAA